jgi:predicted transcriptional regulator of viral defense system
MMKQLNFPDYPFDYNYLIDKLKNYNFPRNKIQRLIKNGEIIRIKKGLYIRSNNHENYIDKKIIANLIYGPSYISLEYALSYWGLIPERVEEVTSINNKRNKKFKTPLGVFSYRYLPTNKFNIGVDLIQANELYFFIATKEKALCDKLYFSSKLANQQELIIYLEDDLRIDMYELEELNKQLLLELKERYKKPTISLFIDWYLNNY